MIIIYSFVSCQIFRVNKLFQCSSLNYLPLSGLSLRDSSVRIWKMFIYDILKTSITTKDSILH